MNILIGTTENRPDARDVTVYLTRSRSAMTKEELARQIGIVEHGDTRWLLHPDRCKEIAKELWRRGWRLTNQMEAEDESKSKEDRSAEKD